MSWVVNSTTLWCIVDPDCLTGIIMMYLAAFSECQEGEEDFLPLSPNDLELPVTSSLPEELLSDETGWNSPPKSTSTSVSITVLNPKDQSPAVLMSLTLKIKGPVSNIVYIVNGVEETVNVVEIWELSLFL